MGFFPEANLTHIHPPKGLVVMKASRFLSENDEMKLVALLHAVLQSNEDERFPWPDISRGSFDMKFFDYQNDLSVVACDFRFAGSENITAKYKVKQLSLILDGGEKFEVKIKILPSEFKVPGEPGWHSLCLMRNVDLELAYATLVFLEIWRPHNEKLKAHIDAEKRAILGSPEYEYSSIQVWQKRLKELERCIRDAISGGIYAPSRANWGLGRIPQLYRDYCEYFKQEGKK